MGVHFWKTKYGMQQQTILAWQQETHQLRLLCGRENTQRILKVRFGQALQRVTPNRDFSKIVVQLAYLLDPESLRFVLRGGFPRFPY